LSIMPRASWIGPAKPAKPNFDDSRQEAFVSRLDGKVTVDWRGKR
jgi:hypothetical protein